MPDVRICDKNIPKMQYRGRECYRWEGIANVAVPFVYGHIRGELTILRSYKNKRGEYLLDVRFLDHAPRTVRSYDLISGHIGACIGAREMDYKYFPGQRVKDRHRDITVLAVYHGPIDRIGTLGKMLAFRCNICGYENAHVREGIFAGGGGCPVCNGKIVMAGYNDIPTTAPWMIPYFPGGREQAAGYTQSSGKRLLFQCPYCGRMADKEMMPATLNRTHSIACPCGDGISFPEKFAFHFMKAAGVAGYIRQFSHKDSAWCGSYRYDGSFLHGGRRILLETHGLQHYEKTGFEKFTFKTLRDVAENDRRKRERALANGILPADYIELDCRETSLSHLRDSILQSPLSELLGLDVLEIDWERVFLAAHRPVNRRIIELALQERQLPTKEIAEQCGVSAGHVARVLANYGIYEKEDKNMRKDKTYYFERRAQLFARMAQMQQQNPSVTIARMANALGRTPAAVYRLLRTGEHPLDTDLLHRSALADKARGLQQSVCKPVQVTGPDGKRYSAASLTNACKMLEEIYGVPFAISSACVSIKGNRLYRGCRFRYSP